MADDSGEQGAFAFTGDWREFAPIAFTNLLLSIVTLGIYLFWARARERRYLWSRTRFIDDRLEWTGTGLELLIGYVLAFFLFILPLGALQFGIQALVLRGHPGAAFTLIAVLYLLLLYLVGIAIFRAVRYRLSRTFWHGIRGGSDTQGLAYGWAHLWRTLLGSVTLGLAVPWTMTSLWNRRWNEMSFGPKRFHADAHAGPIFLRFLLFYLVPVILFFAIGAAMVAAIDPRAQVAAPMPGQVPAGFIAAIVIGYVVFFIVLGAVALFYYAAFFREAVGAMSLGEFEFAFNASTWAWFKLFAGNVALVILTLGIGQIFLGYRNWAFFVRHMEAYGQLQLDDFTQSTTREPGQGEGLLDAFDIGAF